MNISHAKFDFNKINYIYGNPASGKSAIFEAIRICLSDDKRASTYGSYVSQGKATSTIHLESILEGKPVTFDVTLNRVNGTPFECITNYDGQVYKNSGVKTFLKSKDIDYYLKIIFSSQHEKDVVDQTPSTRLLYMQKLFNFDFTDQKQKITESISEHKDKISVLLGEMQTIDSSKAFFQSKEPLKQKLLSLKERTEVEADIKEVSGKLLQYDSQIKESLSKRDVLFSKQKNILCLESKIKELNDSITRAKNSKNEKETLENEISTFVKDIECLKQEVITTNNESLGLKAKLDEKKELIASLIRETDKLTLNLESLKEKLKLIENGVCPTCGQNTSKIEDADSIKESIKLTTEKISALSENIKGVQNDVNTIQDEIRDKNNELLSKKEALTKQEVLLRGAENKLNNLVVCDIGQIEKSLNETKASYEAEKVLVDTLEKELQDIDTYITDQKELQKKQNDLKNLLIEDDKIDLLNKEIEKNNNEKDRKLLEIEKQSSELTSSLDDVRKSKDAFEDAHNILNKLLPQYESMVYCSTIEDKLNNFISAVFPSYHITMETTQKGCNFLYTKNKNITDEKRNKFLDVQMSSGFERTVLNIAFKVVLAELYGIDIFIGDEIDKAANDNNTISLIDNIIDTGIYNQVFLISHKKSLYEYFINNFDSNELSIFKADSGQFIQKY